MARGNDTLRRKMQGGVSPPTSKPVLPLRSRGGYGGINQYVEINFETARNEVDDAGNVTRVIKPYDINGIINRVKTEYQQKAGQPMSQKNLTQLTNIITVSQGFIGAHYHTLHEWAHDNIDIVAPVLGFRARDVHQNEILIDCGGDCSQTAIGSCNGVCAGSLCSGTQGATDTSTGNVIIKSAKTYGIKITIHL